MLEMNELLNKIYKKVIVSCQAAGNDPLHEGNCLLPMAKSVTKGGASGLRLAEPWLIREVKKLSDIPIIGLTKPEIMPNNWLDSVYITPTYEDAKLIAEAGADIIAIDGTDRKRPAESIEELIFKIKKNLKKIVMADVSTVEEGIICAELGADMVSTTLSGYTRYTLDKNNGEPDFELLQGLINKLDMPVILEGRIWTPGQVKLAIDSGAFAAVIGSAITRPEMITRRFAEFQSLSS